MANPFINFGQFFVQLANVFRGRPLSSGTRVFNITTPEVYAPIDSESAIRKGFNDNISVYSIVMKDAKKFGSIPMYVYDASKKEEKAIKAPIPLVARLYRELKALSVYKPPDSRLGKLTSPANQLSELLKRPNKNESQDVFLTRLRAYYKICGECFIWLNRGDIEGYRNEDGLFDDEAIDILPVLEMVVLPSQLMTIIPNPDDLWGVLGYILEIGEKLVIRKNDVIHWKNINLDFDAATREHLRGMTPLKPGAKTLEESNSLAKASMRSSQNDGAKAVMYQKIPGQLTPSQQTDIKRVVDTKINNTDVTGSVATIAGDWGLLDLSMSAKDQMQIEKKKMSWQELCFLFDVPVEFFDPETTFANKEQALLGWVTNDIIPACKQFNGELNRALLKAFKLDGHVIIASDYSELQEIQKGMVEAAKTMQEIWSLSPDDVRDILGFEPLGGDFAEPWVPGGRTPLSKANMDDGMGAEDQIAGAYGRGN